MRDVYKRKEYYALKAELAELQEKLSAFENAGGRAQKFLKLTERHAAFTDLTPAILNEFVSRIEVHERDKKRAKQAIQHISIYFNYIGRFENEVTQLAEPTEQEIRQMREKIEEAQKEKSRAYHRQYSRAVSYTHLDVYKRQEEASFRNSFGLPTDPFPTLLASDVTPFSFWYEDDPEGGCIRFVTETESERLMGLPEGWTKYGADGEEIRSSSRYKALGNAIALPCADYIMAGIYEALTGGDGKEEIPHV